VVGTTGSAGAGKDAAATSAGKDAATVADVGEDGLVRSVLARFPSLPPGVLVGPGDDAAVLEVAGSLPRTLGAGMPLPAGGSRVVVSTDTLVEGYDFRRDWSGADDVGGKTAAQSLADIAAMGAVPFCLVVSLTAPADLPVEWARGFADGLAGECTRAGAAVVGGDVSQAREIVITATAVGLLAGEPVLRSGARPGDVIALAGAIGHSAAGLALLQAGVDVTADPVLSELVQAHRAPRPPYPAGPIAARGGATAMIDTSDGLLRDARRVAEASGVVLDLDPVALAPGDNLRQAARAVGDRGLALAWALTGGEDHCLLACFPADAARTGLPEPFVTVGVVRAVDHINQPEQVTSRRPGPGVLRPGPDVLVAGRPHRGCDGWHHFMAGTTSSAGGAEREVASGAER
jgi:thiamine-monophosphate kinase